MRKRLLVLVAAFALALVLAAPALAVDTGAGGAGAGFGQHHATHAQEMGGFTGEMNPGVMHQGFSGWAEHMEP
jgi:hypothetical protein